MIATTTYTPIGLMFEPERHHYTLNGRALLSVTGALAAADLVDTQWFTEGDRQRGTRVHAAIEHYHERTLSNGPLTDPEVAPYLRAYHRFLAESAFRVDACEERLADADLRVAGTLDLRGQFINRDATPHERVDIVDVKTGTAPPWVGFQTAGYVRLLPAAVRPRCRRWALALRADASYRLLPLDERHDARVFEAAVVIAQWKRGWL